jgi:hypothetical protein
VVRRALESDVERQLDAANGRLVAQMREVLEGAQLRVDALVAALSDPIAQGEPGSDGSGDVVLSRPLRWVVPIGWIGGR